MSSTLSTKNNLYGFLLIAMGFVGLSFFFFAHIANAGFIINRPLTIGLSDGLVGYWTFDGSDVAGIVAYDKSGNNNDATTSPSSSPSYPPAKAAGKIGQALNFDGLGNSWASTKAINLSGTNVISASFWYKAATPSGNSRRLLSLSPIEDDGTDGLTIQLNSNSAGCTGNVYASLQGNVGYNTRCFSSPSYDTWHHVVIVADKGKASEEMMVYVDNASVAKLAGADANNTNNFGTQPFYFMCRYTGGSGCAAGPTNGTIDDVRIYNRAITADEIKRLYKIGATTKIGVSRKDTLTDGLVGYWTFDGPDMAGIVAYDKSGNNNNATTSPSSSPSYPPAKAAGKIGQALQFDGLGNSWTSTKEINLSGTNAITASFWYKAATPSGNNKRLLSLSPIDDDGTDGLTIQLNSSVAGCTGNVYASLQGNVGYNQQCFAPPSYDAWHHVVIVADKGKASEELITYVDGVPVVKLAGLNADNTNNFGTQPFYFMTKGEAQAGSTNGTIDDVRVYNRALSADEIKRLYKIGATTKIGVSRKDTLTDGLMGYWTFDGPDVAGTAPFTAFDVSGGNKSATSTGSAVPSKTIGRIGQGLQFNGTDDYLSTLTMNFNNSNAVSVSLWVNITRNAITGEDTIMEISNDADVSTSGISLNLPASGGCANGINVYSLGNVGYSNYCTLNRPVLNTWHHYVLIVDRSKTPDTVFYLDGTRPTQSGGDGSDNTNTFGSEPMYFANRGSSSAFTGVKIDDVRVYNRALSADEIKRLYNTGR